MLGSAFYIYIPVTSFDLQNNTNLSSTKTSDILIHPTFVVVNE